MSSPCFTIVQLSHLLPLSPVQFTLPAASKHRSNHDAQLAHHVSRVHLASVAGPQLHRHRRPRRCVLTGCPGRPALNYPSFRPDPPPRRARRARWALVEVCTALASFHFTMQPTGNQCQTIARAPTTTSRIAATASTRATHRPSHPRGRQTGQNGITPDSAVPAGQWPHSRPRHSQFLSMRRNSTVQYSPPMHDGPRTTGLEPMKYSYKQHPGPVLWHGYTYSSVHGRLLLRIAAVGRIPPWAGCRPSWARPARRTRIRLLVRAGSTHGRLISLTVDSGGALCVLCVLCVRPE